MHGFVRRMTKEVGAWKPNADLAKRLDHFPKEFTAIAVSDPRPTLRAVLSFWPAALTLANSAWQ